MKATRILVILFLLIVAINALVAGFLFMQNPSGGDLGMNVALLQYSPFSDFFIPGLVLFTANGLMNLVVVVLIFLKWKHYPGAVVFQSMVLIAWIIIQVIMLREVNFLHYTIAGVGVLLFVCGNRLNI